MATKQRNTKAATIPENSLLLKTSTSDSFRVNATLAGYDSAVAQAESEMSPYRYTLIRYYEEVLKKDGHLKNLLGIRTGRISGQEYFFKVNGEKVEMPYYPWFGKILKHIMGAVFQGNSLIEILKKDSDVVVNLIPRVNVIPEFGMVKAMAQSTEGTISIYDKPQSKSLVSVNANDDVRDLGLMLTLTRLSLMKIDALTNWGEFLETYMQPLAVGTTDSKDAMARKAIEKFLSEVGRKKWMLKDSMTKLEFQDATGGNANPEMYVSFREAINDEMSEVVLGATMITEDGSSRSQAEVHNSTSMLITKDDMKFVRDVINTQVIPILVDYGVLPEGAEFSFEDSEVLSVDEKLKVDEFLLKHFDLPLDYIKSRYNIPFDLKLKSQPTIE